MQKPTKQNVPPGRPLNHWGWVVIFILCAGVLGIGLLFSVASFPAARVENTQKRAVTKPRPVSEVGKQYRNQKYHYQLTYPQGWEKLWPTLEPEEVAFAHGAQLGDGKITFAKVTINAAPMPSEAIAAWQKRLKMKTFIRRTIAGIEAFETSATTSEGFKHTYEFAHSNQLFVIETLLTDAASTLVEVRDRRKTDDEYRRLFEAILASFRFTS